MPNAKQMETLATHQLSRTGFKTKAVNWCGKAFQAKAPVRQGCGTGTLYANKSAPA
jgi:hypothetical protein